MMSVPAFPAPRQAPPVHRPHAPVRTPTEPTMSMPQAIATLGISRKQILRLVQQGRIRCLQPGPRPRYRQADIEVVSVQRQRWLAQAQEYYTYTQARQRIGGSMTGFYQLVTVHQVRRLPGKEGMPPGYHKADINAIAAQGIRASRLADVSDAYYTAEQVAERLQIDRRTIPSLVQAGELHPVAVAGYGPRAYAKDEVEALVLAPKRELAHPDANAYAALYAAFAATAVGYVKRRGLTHEQAEDLVQSEFVDLWSYGAAFFAEVPTLERQCQVLYHRLRMRVIKWYEHRRVESEAEREIMLHHLLWCRPTTQGIEAQVIQRDDLHRLLQVSRERLSPALHQLVQLVVQGYTTDEIAAWMQEHSGVTWERGTIANKRAAVMAQVRAWCQE